MNKEYIKYILKRPWGDFMYILKKGNTINHVSFFLIYFFLIINQQSFDN